MKNRIAKSFLALALVSLLAGAPAFAGRGGGSGTRSVSRTSVSGGANVHRNVSGNVNQNVNVNRNTNVNVNRNTNVNVHRDVDVDVHHHGGYYGGCCYHDDYHPVAAVAAVAVTAAVIGSIVYSLPPACTVVYVNGITYQQCGSTWYQPRFVGTTTSYVIVAAPR